MGHFAISYLYIKLGELLGFRKKIDLNKNPSYKYPSGIKTLLIEAQLA